LKNAILYSRYLFVIVKLMRRNPLISMLNYFVITLWSDFHGKEVVSNLVKERAPEISVNHKISFFFFFVWNRVYRILLDNVQNQFKTSIEIAVEIARLFRSPFRRIVRYSRHLISFREILVERINLDFWSRPSVDESAGLYVVWIVKAEWVMTDLTCYD